MSSNLKMNGVASPTLYDRLICLACQRPLSFDRTSLHCRCGQTYEVVRGIPRFVESDAYVRSFSFEWNTHTNTQLDSNRADSYAEWSLIQKTGLSPADVRGKLVLDAGIGAGRYSEILLEWGAQVIGVDLSYSVEAAQRNLEHFKNMLVLQADIGKLPFAPGTFDYIISIGVLHHTPETKTYFNALVPLLKPGGSIAIWVYPTTQDYANRAAWIPFTYRIPHRMFYAWCRTVVPFLRKRRSNAFVRWFAEAFPYSQQPLGIENDILDTFDGFSPRFHGVHTPEEVERWFKEAGLGSISRPSAFDTCVRGTLLNSVTQ